MSETKSLEQTDSSSEVFPKWLSLIYKDNAYEVAENTPVVLLMLPQSVRSIVWKLLYNMVSEQVYVGLGGQACKLLERYLEAYIARFSHLPIDCPEWQKTKWALFHRILLLAAVSIQLVTKMDSAQTYISIRDTQTILKSENRYYTLQEIRNAETEVFRGIGHRLELLTTVDKALMLANEVGMSSQLIEAVGLLMDITDYHRPMILEQLNEIAFDRLISTKVENGPDPKTSRTGHIQNMHLAASVVAATGKFFKFNGPDPIQKLARWTRSPERYINCICNIIITKILTVKLKEFKRKIASRTTCEPSKIKRRRQC